jgi:hypothetical protein
MDPMAPSTNQKNSTLQNKSNYAEATKKPHPDSQILPTTGWLSSAELNVRDTQVLVNVMIHDASSNLDHRRSAERDIG